MLSTPDHTWTIDTWRVAGWQDQMRSLMADPTRLIIGHNLLFDLQFLLAAGLEVDAELFDTMIAAQLLDNSARLGQKGAYSLAGLARDLLGVEVDKALQKSDWGREALTPDQLQYA